MNKINWMVLALLGVAAAANAGNGRIGSGSDGLIFEPGKTPSDAVVTVGSFGSIEVRGPLGALWDKELGDVTFYRCSELDSDGSPKMGSCDYVGQTSINKKIFLIPSPYYLIEYFGVFYPTLVPVIKDTNTVIRLQRIVLADNGGQFEYTFAKDLDSPEMLANIRMGLFSRSTYQTNSSTVRLSSEDWENLNDHCSRPNEIYSPEFRELCAAIKTQNKALILEKLFPVENNTIRPLTLSRCTPDCSREWLESSYLLEWNESKLHDSDRISVFPGVYRVLVQGQMYKGIVVPMPN